MNHDTTFTPNLVIIGTCEYRQHMPVPVDFSTQHMIISKTKLDHQEADAPLSEIQYPAGGG